MGNGAYLAKTAFPEQETFRDPVPLTRIIVFRIRRTSGTFGTVLTGNLPDAVNHYRYAIGIYLTLFRRYAFAGQQRSYISVATCPFARASMTFADGRRLSSTLTRSGKVSG